MARFNTRPSGLIVPTPIVSTPSPTARTGNNAPGFVRDAKSELFLLAVANFVGQDTFYEAGGQRDQRYINLIHQVAGEDPAWLSRFLIWLRTEANMRTAAVIGAVEFCRVFKETNERTGQGYGYPRATMCQVLQRADEPGEAVAYHLATYGRKLPKSMKRGIADAVAARLYNEYNTLKYDTGSKAVRFADVLELCHVKPIDGYQTALFPYLLAKRHNRDDISLDGLRMIRDNATLRAYAAQQPEHLLVSTNLRAAGMTWEDALSLAGDKVSKKELWEALIPTMGYMALLRNLRNFDQAGVSDEVAQQVAARLTDPEQVVRSRQLPMRFLSAFNAVSNLRWAYPLEQALNLSLQNVPEFGGSTLILIDTSGSMASVFSKDGTLRFWEAAAMFGLALAQRCENVTVVSFSTNARVFPPMQKGASLLPMLEEFRRHFFLNGGTATAAAVQQYYRNHDRVIVLTDEQADAHWGNRGVFTPVPDNKLCVTFNLAGYRVGHSESGSSTRVTIGGLSDQAFKLLPVLERRAAGQWPF